MRLLADADNSLESGDIRENSDQSYTNPWVTKNQTWDKDDEPLEAG
jgi:hypothetical protein